MNFKLTATKKTYYIVGGCSAALALAGAALYLPGYYFDFLFTVSAILAGAMFLLVAAAEGAKTPEGKAALVALLLQLVYFFPGVPQKVGGALAWPVFAAAHFMAAEKEGDNLRTLSFLVMLAGGVQLVFSFVPLGAMFKGVLAVVIALSQLLLCSSLAGREKRNMEKGE